MMTCNSFFTPRMPDKSYWVGRSGPGTLTRPYAQERERERERVEWVSEWVSEWGYPLAHSPAERKWVSVSESVSQWVSESVSESVSEWVRQWVCVWLQATTYLRWGRSLTNDVVRQAIIPRSKVGDEGFALASLWSDGQGMLPRTMVTHNWTNTFANLAPCPCRIQDLLLQV